MKQTGMVNTNWTFTNNVFSNAKYSGSGNWLINGSNNGLVFNLHDNLFTNNEVSNGLSIWDSNQNTISILDNVWQNNGYTALNLNSSKGEISRNKFIDTRTIDVMTPIITLVIINRELYSHRLILIWKYRKMNLIMFIMVSYFIKVLMV
jgi:hypothetical protein